MKFSKGKGLRGEVLPCGWVRLPLRYFFPCTLLLCLSKPGWLRDYCSMEVLHAASWLIFMASHYCIVSCYI